MEEKVKPRIKELLQRSRIWQPNNKNIILQHKERGATFLNTEISKTIPGQLTWDRKEVMHREGRE